MKILYVFFIIDVATRELVHFAVTKKPNLIWLENIFRSAFTGRDDLPKYLTSDRDGIFGSWMSEFLKSYFDITLYRTPPRMPIYNAFSERMILNYRREIYDRFTIYDEEHLRESF